MRMYLTATGRYVATQDEAKADGKGWHLELVPDVKADLIDYLNAKLAAPAPAPEVEAEPPAPVRVDGVFGCHYETPAPASASKTSWTATEIEDFILNHADVNQVANIHACLGTRFAELVRGRA